MATRVEIPAYTDRWMMGDRYGVIVRVVTRRNMIATRSIPAHQPYEIAHVKLDKSGKTVRVLRADCKELE